MIVTYENFTSKERENAIYLQEIAIELGMSLDGAGEIAVNRINGKTYLMLKDYSFILYLSMACELIKYDVWVLYQDKNTGEACEDTLPFIGASLLSIEEWISESINNKIK